MTEIEDTQPVNKVEPDKGKKPRKKRKPFWVTALVVVLILLIGAFVGYRSGISARLTAASQTISEQVDEQFQLGLKALDSGLYQVALANFQFVISKDPNYPGVQDKLVEVLLKIDLPTSTPVVTISVTNTPDTRGVEAIFNQAKDLLASQQWDAAIETLDTLRQQDSTYRAVDVDGIYYVALIQRGQNKIINASCENVNLEGGIYDLTLAESFGPLDQYSYSLREYARDYITGASFWEIDWYQVYYYFNQLRVNVPYLMDSSCMTTTLRFREGAIHYADSLLINREYCPANEIYQEALAIPGDNSMIEPTSSYAYNHCQRSLITETTAPPPLFSTSTPTPPGAPTDVPTDVPTEVPTS